MNFVQSIFLFGLAGLALPVIMHLIFRWQTRRVDLGTTRFLADTGLLCGADGDWPSVQGLSVSIGNL